MCRLAGSSVVRDVEVRLALDERCRPDRRRNPERIRRRRPWPGSGVPNPQSHATECRGQSTVSGLTQLSPGSVGSWLADMEGSRIKLPPGLSLDGRLMLRSDRKTAFAKLYRYPAITIN